MLKETEDWWAEHMTKLVEKHQKLQNRLKVDPDLDGDIASEVDQLEKQIQSLILKSHFELKEIDKLEKLEREVNKKAELDLIQDLSRQITQKLKLKHVKTKRN